MITTVEVTLSRLITEDGRLLVSLKIPAHFNAVELLGLLELGKLLIREEMDL